MDLSHGQVELFASLAKAQGELADASKNKKNPHFRSEYADLSAILEVVRPVFSKHGLSIIQSTEFDGAMVSVTTAICHESGGYVTSTASCVPAKTDAMGIGASTTYLRRYGCAAMVGITQTDDDGQEAAHEQQPRKPALVKKQISDKDFESLTSSVKAKKYDSFAAVLERLEKSKVTLSDEQKDQILGLFSEAA